MTCLSLCSPSFQSRSREYSLRTRNLSRAAFVRLYGGGGVSWTRHYTSGKQMKRIVSNIHFLVFFVQYCHLRPAILTTLAIYFILLLTCRTCGTGTMVWRIWKPAMMLGSVQRMGKTIARTPSRCNSYNVDRILF